MYVAVKGGETAIGNAHRLLAKARRGDPAVPVIGTDQIAEQLGLAVDRVMVEGSLFDREISALAIRQARGDLIEAIFLVRAYRTTLPRFGASEPLDTGRMVLRRRVSAAFKDLPGGQVLGPTFDYTHRLIDFAQPADPGSPAAAETSQVLGSQALGAQALGAQAPGAQAPGVQAPCAHAPRVADLLGRQGLIEQPAPGDADREPGDLTRQPLAFPAARDLRLQNLARGDEGFLLSLAYSTQRGFGRTHPFVGDVRFGEVEVEFFAEEVGLAIPLGRIAVTECEMINQFKGSEAAPPQFTTGYGLAFGQSERKCMSMALIDRALRCDEFGEERTSPAQDEEFVLSHSDNIQATGFVEHLKLPHYVDFQSELGLLRRLRDEWSAQADGSEPEAPT